MTTFPQSAGTGIARTILVSLLVLTSAPPVLDAQDTNATPASLLRVLAEAADAHRTGKPVYLVAERRFPHSVIGHFSSRDEAMRFQRDSGASFGVFGPYVTPADPPAAGPTMYKVRLFYRTPQGQVRTKDVDPAEVDALFMSMSAVDKFMVPYYAKVYGPDYAERLRDDVVTIKVVGHRFSVGDSLRPGGSPIRPLEPEKAAR